MALPVRQDYFNVIELPIHDGYPHTFVTMGKFCQMKFKIEKYLSNSAKYSMGRITPNFSEVAKMSLTTPNIGIAIFSGNKKRNEKHLAYLDFPVQGDENVEKLFPTDGTWYCIIKVYDDVELAVLIAQLACNGLVF